MVNKVRLCFTTTVIPTLTVQNAINQMIIKYRFKFYPHVVCDDNRTLWQLEHFKNKRTLPLKKLTYNKDRKAFRINSQWVSRKRLLKFKIETDEILDVEVLSPLDSLLRDFSY